MQEIYVIAGESSGDALGAQMMRSIRRLVPSIQFAGVGGTAMMGAGLASLFPMRDLSVMGLMEVLPKLPLLISRINQCARDIIRRQPAVVVTIDSPDFTFRVLKKVRAKCPKTKFIHYVAPTVWAWRPERAAKLAKLVDGLMCLFPFEPHYFTPHGLKAVCVGHPAALLKQNLPQSCSAFCDKYDLIESQLPTAVTLLFGSRMGELERLGPVMFEAAHILLAEWPSLTLFVPAVPHLQAAIKSMIGSDQRFVMVDPQDRYQAFTLSGAALAASGTVGLELAMLDVPHVVAYRLNKLSYKMAQRMVTVQHMHLVNILLSRRVVPEFLQDDCKPEQMAAAALDLLANRDGCATRQRTAFADARHLLLGDGGGTPSDQAAQFVVSML